MHYVVTKKCQQCASKSVVNRFDCVTGRAVFFSFNFFHLNKNVTSKMLNSIENKIVHYLAYYWSFGCCCCYCCIYPRYMCRLFFFTSSFSFFLFQFYLFVLFLSYLPFYSSILPFQPFATCAHSCVYSRVYKLYRHYFLVIIIISLFDF